MKYFNFFFVLLPKNAISLLHKYQTCQISCGLLKAIEPPLFLWYEEWQILNLSSCATQKDCCQHKPL